MSDQHRLHYLLRLTLLFTESYRRFRLEDLEEIECDDEEVKSLSEVLPRFAQLKSVNLRRNERIGEAGVNTLVKSLLTPGAAPRLNEVNLQLTGAAAVAERLYAITEAMKKRPTLWYV